MKTSPTTLLLALTASLISAAPSLAAGGCPKAMGLASPNVEILQCLRVGHWVEVRGELMQSGVFSAERIELLRARSAASVWGLAERGNHSRELRVLGRNIEVSKNTEWRGGDLATVLGQRVRVRGYRGVAGTILAERVERRDPGIERISGRIDAIHGHQTGTPRLEILGFEVVLRGDIRQRIEEPASVARRSPPRALQSSSSLVVDDDDLFGDGYRLHPQLHLGLQQAVAFNSRRNFELDDRDDRDPDDQDDRDDTSHQLRGRLTWTPGPKVTALVDLRHRLLRRDVPGQDALSDSRTRLGEAFLLARDIGFGLDLQIGRQDHEEPREWLYDQNLDGVRLFRQTRRLHMELSASTTLSDGSRRDQDANNIIWYLANRQGRRHFAGYLIHRDFGQQRAERQSHAGLRALGPWTEHLEGWAELSYLNGQRSSRPVSAWGSDLGLSWRSTGPARWTFTFGLAQGSGDRGGDTDRRFRQTGLQDNDARLGGVTSIRYYGELFDPELSNLRIATVGIGARFLRRSSIELVGHTYRQVVPSQRLTNTSLDRRPDGVSGDLGWELDVIVGVRRFDAWSIELVGAHFSQGVAFPSGDDATMARIQIRYRY